MGYEEDDLDRHVSRIHELHDLRQRIPMIKPRFLDSLFTGRYGWLPFVLIAAQEFTNYMIISMCLQMPFKNEVIIVILLTLLHVLMCIAVNEFAKERAYLRLMLDAPQSPFKAAWRVPAYIWLFSSQLALPVFSFLPTKFCLGRCSILIAVVPRCL